MKNRLHGKKAGIAILAALIIISLADVIFRAVALPELAFTTSNFGEQLAVIALAVTILVLNAKGKDRACYICYGAWIGYFVLDQIFELPGSIISTIKMFDFNSFIPDRALGLTSNILFALSSITIIAIGALLVEYMSDGTIYNRAFNILCVLTTVMILGYLAIPVYGAITSVFPEIWLVVFNGLYRLAMVFLFTFFAYDSAKMQLKKVNFSK